MIYVFCLNLCDINPLIELDLMKHLLCNYLAAQQKVSKYL